MSLCIHTPGSHRVTLDELRTLPAPVPMGSRHVPIKHSDYVDAIHGALDDRGFGILKTEIGIARRGLQVFGTVQVAVQGQTDVQTVGFRSANDCTISLQMVAGFRVFVCDNLCFSGDVHTLRRKHTKGVDLVRDVAAGIDRWQCQADALRADLDGLHDRPVSDGAAKEFLTTSVLRGIVPGSAIPKLWRLWNEPPHPEFAERTAYALYQAYTEHFKSMSGAHAFESNVNLGRLLKLGAPASE